MKVAFLFVEEFPVEDYICNVISQLDLEKLHTVESYMRAGTWGIVERREVYNVFYFGSGNFFGFSPNSYVDDLLTNSVFVVQFDSIKRNLALNIHTKLKSMKGYLGFTEVKLDNSSHYKAFTVYGPIAKIENKKINFLYTSESEESEENADFLIENMKKNYFGHGMFVAKKDLGMRFSALDKYGDSKTDHRVDKALQVLHEDWEYRTQEIIYKLQDIDSNALDELLKAIDLLKKTDVTSADVAQIAVNLRRFLEKIIDTLVPPKSQTDKGQYLQRFKQFITTNIAEDGSFYAEYIEEEVNDLYTRMKKLRQIGNKGIHEDLLVNILTKSLLRSVILVHDFLYDKYLKTPAVYYDIPIFESDRE